MDRHDVFGGMWFQGLAVGIGLGYIPTMWADVPGFAVIAAMLAVGLFGILKEDKEGQHNGI